MKCGRFRRWWLIPLGLPLIPSFLWLAIVIAAPTNWARTRLARAIESATGRSVRLDRLSVCLLGGMRLTNLEIGAPGALEDPWFRAGEVTLDLSPLSVFRGHLKPGRLEIHDANLRILRRKDGTLELSDLVRPAGREPGRPAENSDCCALGTCLTGAHRLWIGIHRARIVLVDQLNKTSDELEEVEGEATLEGKAGGVFSLGGNFRGGTVQMTGRFDRTMKEPSIDVQLVAAKVDLAQDSRGLRYLIPVLAGEESRLEGKLAAQASFQARGSDVTTLRKSLLGQGAVELDPVRLKDSSFLDTICKLAELPPTDVTDSIHARFEIENQRITTHASTIQLGPIPIRLTGWTDFDGTLDYKIHLDSLTSRIPPRALRFLQEIDLDVEKVSILELSGNVDQVSVQVDGEPLNFETSGTRPEHRDDRERLRILGRKLLDRIVR
jgi:hypothetical protein